MVDERNDLPTLWTQNGASVIFHGDRRRRWEIYSIVNDRSGFQSVDWSADGRGWYVSTAGAGGARILYILEDGQAKAVRDQPRGFGTWAIPSPDGTTAILEWSAVTNV